MTSTIQRISPAEAAALLRAGDTTLFDVRDPADYRAGHIDGAAHLDQSRFPGWLKRLPRDATLLIYCYKGNASQVYAQMFADFRFTRVFSVDGGYAALRAAVDGATV